MKTPQCAVLDDGHQSRVTHEWPGSPIIQMENLMFRLQIVAPGYSIFRAAAACALAIVLIGPDTGDAEAQAFSELIVFGDSVSDTGNWWVGGTPPPQFVGGRFSNGPVWVEELASQFDLPTPLPSEAGGTNYAWGGARTGQGIDWVDVIWPLDLHAWIPTTGSQIDQYLANHVPGEDQLIALHAA